MAGEAEQEIGGSKRERSPSFPYLDLNDSLDLLRKLFRAVKMNDVRLTDLANMWGTTPTSGSFLRYIAALNQFGLIESSGSGDTRKFKVSASGRRILEDDRPGVRELLLSQAAQQPKLIRGLFFGEDGMHVWGRDRPADTFAESYLKFELQFSADAAKRFLGIYDTTVLHIITEDEAADQSKPENDPSEAVSPAQIGTEPPLATSSSIGGVPQQPTNQSSAPQQPIETTLNQIVFKSDGAGIISIVATLDADGLDILAKKIEAFKMLLS